jgi:L-alanine-DL-glutamate epimerase-like enolase superfamily enzyme
MGGLLRSLEVLGALRKARLGLIVGAHVGETSVLTRAALTVANHGRDILIAQEGAFGTHLLVHDVVESPLMFGRGGVMEWKSSGRPGFGLDVKTSS